MCLRLVLKNLRRRSSTVCRSFLPNEDEMISTLSLSKRSFAFNTTPSTKERKREKNNTFFLRAEEAVRKRILREVGTRSTTLKFQSDASRLRIGCNSNRRKNSCVSTQPPFFFRKLFHRLHSNVSNIISFLIKLIRKESHWYYYGSSIYIRAANVSRVVVYGITNYPARLLFVRWRHRRCW